MFLDKKKTGAVFSDLRARLDEYAGMKGRQMCCYGTGEGERRRGLFSYYPLCALRRMHSFIFVKVTLVFFVILVVFALNLIELPIFATILQNIHYMTTTTMDFRQIERELLPALQRLWTGTLEDGWDRAVIAPGAQEQAETKEDGIVPFVLPVEGQVERGFGTFEDPYGNTYMSYGLLLNMQAVSDVYASAAGVVREIGMDPLSGYTLVLEHRHSMETCYAYLQEVFVKEGEAVGQGQVIGRTGGVETAEGSVFLYFEIREKGRPLDPLPLLAAF